MDLLRAVVRTWRSLSIGELIFFAVMIIAMVAGSIIFEHRLFIVIPVLIICGTAVRWSRDTLTPLLAGSVTAMSISIFAALFVLLLPSWRAISVTGWATLIIFPSLISAHQAWLRRRKAGARRTSQAPESVSIPE